MGKECSSLRIKALTMDNILQTYKKVKEQEFMKMAVSMKVTGLMMKDTVQGNTLLLQELFKMEIGRMINL